MTGSRRRMQMRRPAIAIAVAAVILLLLGWTVYHSAHGREAEAVSSGGRTGGYAEQSPTGTHRPSSDAESGRKASARNGLSKDEEVVILESQDDGTDEFRRSPGGSLITRISRGSDGKAWRTVVYHVVGDRISNGDLYDGNGKLMAKVRYGYGAGAPKALLEEQIFDPEGKRVSPETGKDLPMGRYVYPRTARGGGGSFSPLTDDLPASLTALMPTALDIDPFAVRSSATGR